MNNAPLIFGSRPRDPAYSRLRADPGGQLEAPKSPVSRAPGWSDLHFKGFRIYCRGKDTGESLFLRLSDSKGLVILGHPAEDFPRTNFRVKQEKFSKVQPSTGEARGEMQESRGKKARARKSEVPQP